MLFRPDIVVQACNLSAQRQRQENGKFQASLGYISKTDSKTTVLDWLNLRFPQQISPG
jgi:hypothetical protein